jgi:hypothetical protein
MCYYYGVRKITNPRVSGLLLGTIPFFTFVYTWPVLLWKWVIQAVAAIGVAFSGWLLSPSEETKADSAGKSRATPRMIPRGFILETKEGMYEYYDIGKGYKALFYDNGFQVYKGLSYSQARETDNNVAYGSVCPPGKKQTNLKFRLTERFLDKKPEYNAEYILTKMLELLNYKFGNEEFRLANEQIEVDWLTHNRSPAYSPMRTLVFYMRKFSARLENEEAARQGLGARYDRIMQIIYKELEARLTREDVRRLHPVLIINWQEVQKRKLEVVAGDTSAAGQETALKDGDTAPTNLQSDVFGAQDMPAPADDSARTRPRHKTPHRTRIKAQIRKLGDLTQYNEIAKQPILETIKRLRQAGTERAEAAADKLEALYKGHRIRAVPDEGVFEHLFGTVYKDEQGQQWILIAKDIASARNPELIPTLAHEAGAACGYLEKKNQQLEKAVLVVKDLKFYSLSRLPRRLVTKKLFKFVKDSYAYFKISISG